MSNSKMTKRLYSTEETPSAVFVEDDDQECKDLDEPMLDGSDDEFLTWNWRKVMTCHYHHHLYLTPHPQAHRHTPHPQAHLHPSPTSSPPDLPSTWSTSLKPVTVKSFDSPVGPTFAVLESAKEVFELFFSADLTQLVVDESNRYAEQVMGSEKFTRWNKITVDEFKAYLGFYILMGICELPSIKDYWQQDEFLHYSPIADRISRDRF